MNNFVKNVLLLIVALVLSYFTAGYFGGWYDKFSPQYGGSFFNFSRDTAIFVAGIPFAYVCFVPFIFTLFGFGNRKKWIAWLLAPALFLFVSADRYHIYLPILLSLIAYGLAVVLRKIFRM